MPRLGLRGIQRLHLLDDVMILGGAGVGGGSLVYANTLLVPPDEVLDAPGFAVLGGKTEMAPTTRPPAGCWASRLRPSAARPND